MWANVNYAKRKSSGHWKLSPCFVISLHSCLIFEAADAIFLSAFIWWISTCSHHGLCNEKCCHSNIFRDRYEAVSSPSSFLVWGSPLFCVQCDGVCHYRSLPLLSSAGSNTPPSGRWSGSGPWWWGRGREEELYTPMRPRGHALSHTSTSYHPHHLSVFLFLSISADTVQ